MRAVGRRARRSTGQAAGDRVAMRPARAVSPPHRRRGTCPSDRRRPCWLRFVGVGTACGRRPVSRSSASRARRSGGLPAPPLWRDPPLRPGPHRSRLRRSGGLPAIPSAPPLRCPGAVTPRAVRSWLGPGLGCSLALAADPSPTIGSLAMPRSEDRLAARRPVRLRRRGPCGSPSTRTKARHPHEAWLGAARRNRRAHMEAVTPVYRRRCGLPMRNSR